MSVLKEKKRSVSRTLSSVQARPVILQAQSSAHYFSPGLPTASGAEKLFLITLALYLSATAANPFSWNFCNFLLFRFLTGAGIGGEYAAINSVIDELAPAAVRGNVDLMIDATFWTGAGVRRRRHTLPSQLRSRVSHLRLALRFGIGALLGLVILLLRKSVPESPRWLMLRGSENQAAAILGDIERKIGEHKGDLKKPKGVSKSRCVITPGCAMFSMQ